MKTQTNNKMTKLVFAALASLMVMTTACSKKGGDSAPAPAVVTPVCTIQPCGGGAGVTGQLLYSGTTSTGSYTQAQFQVFGDQSGNGVGSITGVLNINNYICQTGYGLTTLNGQFTMQMPQPGYLNSDVFTGHVNLVGPQIPNGIPAAIRVVPSRVQNAGLFTVWLCGAENSLNF